MVPQQVQPSAKAAMPARAPWLFSATVWQGPSKKIKQPHKKNVTKDLNSQHKLISGQWTRCNLKWSTVPHLDKNYKDNWVICSHLIRSEKYILRCSWIQFIVNYNILKFQYFGHLMRRVDSLEKTDAGRDWGQEEKGTTEKEMAGWHHWLDGHKFEWILGVGDGQGGLACCDSWGHKESDTTERLNWTELKIFWQPESQRLGLKGYITDPTIILDKTSKC